jgi:hypothetical protein
MFRVLIKQVNDSDIGADKLLGICALRLVDLKPEEAKDIKLELTPALDMSNIVDKKDRGSLTINVSYMAQLLMYRRHYCCMFWDSMLASCHMNSEKLCACVGSLSCLH